MRRAPSPPALQSLSLSTCAEPVPATFPADEVTVQPWQIRPQDMSTLSVCDGEWTYQLNMPSHEATDEFCTRFLALVRGEAIEAAAPSTHRPTLLP